jgi:hypothetical protein
MSKVFNLASYDHGRATILFSTNDPKKLLEVIEEGTLWSRYRREPFENTDYIILVQYLDRYYDPYTMRRGLRPNKWFSYDVFKRYVNGLF